MTVRARAVSADSPDALRLVREMWAGVSEVYGSDKGPGPSAEPRDFSPPGGRFVVLYDDGEPVAGGGVKRLDARTGELKRMYVVPAARGRGLSRRLLDALEDAARDLGYERLRLDTGAQQAAALHLYPAAGYSEIPDYNGNPYAAFWGEKIL